jgi:alkylation response protein AidB-like acyl-CoA dehydrogenase
MLADSVRRALQELQPTWVPPGGRAEDVKPEFEAVGKAMTELGLFGILVPDSQGGLGLGMVDAVAVALETGRAAVPFPAIECMVAMSVAAKARPDIASEIIAGNKFATAPVHGRLSIGNDPRPTVSGTVNLPFAAVARYLLAPLSGPHGEKRTVLSELNGHRGAASDTIDLSYRMSRLDISQEVSDNEIVNGRVDDMLGILAAAEIVGAAEHCLDRTVVYLKERKQFGKVIGTFQALQHIAADCCTQLEAMKASVEYAAALHDKAANASAPNGAAAEAETAFHMAKAYCSEAGLKIAEQCIQMHGGIAFTWEYGLHLHFRRITRLANSHGTPYEHREALASLALAGARTPGGLAADPN